MSCQDRSIPPVLCSSGQNLAALSAAASKNLAAIGCCHSLAETVDLGAVTTAGLIGTLHVDTSCQISIMLNSCVAQP